ncbi:sensor histidine kinase [Dyadobacter frigoris]|uniref:histidine kinase n=1 Tax=Dyadobacter frigoris TaxID=2576211 RepID=A0A4U6D8J1_9BACT|nr:HAMP domain-containing sensor histidine kinase [Dyadobacter frigoris]TKT90494.1 HAMP domain-containing histidine kinase [Dyadobacter frigoris]GLU51375.1 two-component sensor histidine kinase [Dyadobacter frigoris]
MSIKQNITVAFTLIVATILALFSVFVYYSYEDYRAGLMQERLSARAEATKRMLSNPETSKTDVLFPLSEQYEGVYDQHNNLVVATSQTSDYIPDPVFLALVRSKKKHGFTYDSPLFEFKKEGVGLTYLKNGKTYLALVTAYDVHGYNMSRTLLFSLFFGNLLALVIIGITGYFFSRRAMLPFDHLLKQMDKAPVDDFRFRIAIGAQQNEAASLASSFNRLLEKIKELADNQTNFISYASHELRTPLTVIKGVLQTSMSYDNSKAEWKQSASEAVEQVNHAIELSNNLLFLAEIEGLRFTADKQRINIIDLAIDSVSYINQKYPSQPVNLEIVENELNVGDFQAVTEGVPHLLRSAVNNVLDNACKYSELQPVTIRIIEDKQMLVLEISDMGIGILPGDLQNIFLPMMRGQNTGKVNGFGIGLSLVKKIVDFHLGTLVIDSVTGQGTTVSIGLPLKSF